MRTGSYWLGDGTPGDSAVHRAVRTFAGPAIGVALEFGDRLVDPAGVAADDAVDECGRIVKVLRVGQQLRVLPHRIAGIDTGLGHAVLGDCTGYWTPSRIMSLDVAVNLELAVTVSVIQPVRAAVDTACRHAMR